MKSVTLGGSVVLSTGASVGVHVQLRVPRLTTAEKDELESTTIMLRCLTVVKA